MIGYQSNAQVLYSLTSQTGTYAQLTGAGITVINQNSGLTTTAMVQGQDDGIAIITLPFTFTYHGNNFTQAGFCTNGWVGLGDQTAVNAVQGRAAGNLFTGTVPNNTIAAWFKDMGGNFPATQPGTGPGSMRHGLTGTDIYTFQWDQAVGTSFSVNTTTTISFQISIYGPASTNPGRIQILYGPTLGTISFAASIGIENGIGGANNFINAINGSQTLTTTSTAWPGNGNGYRFDPLAPCVTPVDAATGLGLTTISTSQIDGSFTAAVTPPTGYLVVRYPSGAATTNPVTGVAYATGQSLGLGTVVSAGATTTFSSTGLSGATTYDYYVYTYNSTLCSGGPLYYTVITAGQNTGSATTNPCGAMSSPVTVGPTGTYPTLSGAGGAIAAINITGISAPMVIELQSTYTAAGETYPIVMNYNACVTATNTLTIRPEAATASPLTITSANTTATVDMNGAFNVIWDGRPGGVGTNKFLIIENTSTTSASAGNAVLLRNDASGNTFTYLDLKAANANAASNGTPSVVGAIPGVIAIAGTTGSGGNDNNTISYCDVHSTGANLGVCIFAASSSAAGTPANNDNNVITNNNIYDFFIAALASAGINISLGNNNYTITNNRVFQTATRTYTGTQTVRGFWLTANTGSLTSASGYVISGNTIGYNSAAGTGIYTMTGTTTWLYNGMDISLGNGTFSSVQNNNITGINTTSGSTGSTAFVGINVANGNLNIGTVTGNTIGSASVNGAITFTATANLGGAMGIRTGSGTTLNIANNVISGFDLFGSTATVTPVFNGIAASGGTTINITGNTIGSATMANSINAVSASTSASVQVIRGIIVNGGTTSTVSGNLIANINTNIVSTGTQATTLVGIAVTATSSTIVNNTIRNLSSSTQTTGSGATSAIVGISFNTTLASAAPVSIGSNTIHSLKLTHPTTLAATQNVGIFYAGPTTGTANIIQKNFIHSSSIASPTNAAGFLSGIDIASGIITIQNNMIRLGIDADGLEVNTPCTIRGISENSATSNIHNNSVYIGGYDVASSTSNSFAYQRSAIGNADNVRNNIFVNNRSNNSTGGKHYQVFLTTSSLNLTLDYNNYSGGNIGGVFAFNGTSDVSLYSAGWIATDLNSVSGDPIFVDQDGDATAVNLHINPATPTPVEQTGVLISSVTDDYDGQLRAGLTPTDIGADAGNFTPLGVCVGTPPPATSVITTTTPICGSGSKTVILQGYATQPGLTYQWQESATGLPGSYSNVASGGNALSYITPTLTSTTYYQAVIKCSFSPLDSTISSAVQVVVNPFPTVSVTASLSTVCFPGVTPSVLTASGASTYAWTPTSGLTPTTGSPLNALPSTNTTYTVTGTDANGCTATSTVAIAVVGGVGFSGVTASPANVCAGANSILTASAFVPASVNLYTFTAGNGTTLDPMVGATQVLNASNDDTPTATPASIGFTFNYDGVNYTQYSVSPDGWILLGGGTAASSFTNTITLNTNIPKIYPYWDDLATGTDGHVKVLVTGIAPNRIFIAQWQVTIPRNLAGVSNSTFQAWLYENSGQIEFRYGAMGVNTTSVSVGLTGNPATNYNSVTIATNTASTTTPNDGQISTPAAGTIYTFQNPATGVPITYLWTPATYLSSQITNPTTAVAVMNTTTYTVTATSGNGCTSSSSVTVNVDVLTTNVFSSDNNVCHNTALTLSSTTTGGGQPYVYSWTDGMNIIATTSSVAIAPGSTTTYTLTVTDACGGSTNSSITINVNNPLVLTTTPGSRCGVGTVMLGATVDAGATAKWYANPSGGAQLGSGNTFVTPSINATTNFYVASSLGGGTANVPSPTIGIATFITPAIGWGLRFTVNTASDINSVTIRASSTTAGPATIQIKVSDLADNVLYTGALHNFTITTALADYVVPVNITGLPPGNYKMGMTYSNITAIVRESSITGFPYTSPGGEISITAGANGAGLAQTTAAYYWFYNWVISTGCEGSRTAVTATVNTPPTITVSATASTLCAGESTTLSVSSPNPNYIYTWNPGGLTGSSITVTPATTTTYTLSALDNSGGAFNGCANQATLAITVNPILTSVNPTVVSPVCSGTNVTLISNAIAPGYYIDPACATGFIDISVTGTDIDLPANLFDDSEHNISMPSFTFNGTAYTSARIGVNGLIVLGSAAGEVSLANGTLPSTANTAGNVFLAPYWDDLDIQTGLTIKTQTVGNVFIIQFTNATHNNFTTGGITFQVQMNLVSGVITYVYSDVIFGDPLYDAGANATVGIQMSSTSALQYSFNTASLTAGQCVSFTPNSATVSWAGPNGFTSAATNPVLPSVTSLNAGTYTVTATGSNGCSVTSTVDLVINSCNSQLNLTMFIEGYWDGTSGMLPVLANQGEPTTATATDSIDVELRDATAPYAVVASVRTVLNQDGTATSIFPAVSGSYYIVVKHRNAIQTWSANPVAIAATPVNYNFSTAASQAFGNNQVEVTTGIWAFFSGDVATDENMDLLDLGLVETDINNFEFGYRATDINGDGNVDLLDTPALEVNINNFIFSNHP